jgi:hypothetical protein
MTNYKPEVQTDSTGKWYGNGCAFATRTEAEAYVQDLACRWTAVRHTRVVESADAITCRFVDGKIEWPS